MVLGLWWLNIARRPQMKEGQVDPVANRARALFRKIDEFDPLYLRVRAKEKLNVTDEEYNVLLRELKRYMSIAGAVDKPVDMFSPSVDGLWHEFILFTRQYSVFCSKYVGTFLHHAPAVPSLPEQKSDFPFFEVYEEAFGPLPDVWNVPNKLNASESSCSDGSCRSSCRACGQGCNSENDLSSNSGNSSEQGLGSIEQVLRA
jgi:hypothetical protein